ncbi:BSD-like protein [Artemisia annua]|uniref:BSD-like protein n=1 Tax=Artemisia annua TaxID=35608 RepID=A0A2U1NR88_ARTAN|nr:BSD-like protein [Artemisia annua]
MKVLGALASITELLGDSAETIGVISKDLKDFIQSDSDQIPTSLKQLFKITKSDEFTESVVKVTTALTVGFLRGYRVEGRKDDSGISFSERAFEKLFSPAGSGFVSVMVGSFTKNMVMALYADRAGAKDNSVERWVDVIADDKCRKVIADCIQQFVTTMVTVYLDKTVDVNTYDEILAGLTNPKHEEKVRDLLASVCNGAIETFVRTSHQVLTNSRSNGSSDLIRRGSSTISKVLDGQESVFCKLKGRNIQRLAAPSNMRFVLDVTRRVTLATMKSFLGFSLNRLSEGMKRNFQEAYSYLRAKSLIILTICISLYLHMLSGPWNLMQV